ncbi:efflux RND transporter permease subunit [Ketobacter sp.]|uniref:efflux RND transporter permease subunit n=1 Tax=Ketobacter sp. TaxID=2083498 RepID=UPI000F1035BF|nr:efflux RND transporter permease subunit [Ketobacter sp.]RLT97973.1 MAG: efflux RND transporter permease subunit [Ketobacter sp.]
MNAIIAWFAENKVAANLLMVFIVVAGFISLQDTRKEILPNISLDLITITVPYPGASPEDVEKSVLNRIESAIYDLEGIKSLSSKATEHLGVLTLEVAYGVDSKNLLNEIKARVDGIGTFPADVERPIVREISVRNMVAYVVISGNADERSLKNLAAQIEEDLTTRPNISQVSLAASRPYEIAIEVSEAALQRYGMSFLEVANAVRQSSVDLPTGVIKTAQGNVSVKAKGQVYWGEDFEDIVIRALPDGAQVLVRDVATVLDGFKEGVSLSEFNGRPAVALAVYRVGDQNILDVSRELHDYVANPSTYIPEGIHLDVWQDSSVYFKSRMDLLSENAISGLALVFIILLLFLRAQLSFWVSLGIPISFMGAFMMLPYFDGSLNMISLFAFILVLGIVVDDAIIVGENVFTKHREGIAGVRGAILGAQEVQKPVIFSVLTTIIAFAPLIMLPGPEGKLMKVIPIVVICTLMFSLIESLLVLPSHVSGISSDEFDRIPVIGYIQKKFSLGLERFVEKVYSPFLETCLRWRYTTLFGFISILLVALSLMASGWLKVVFFSTIEADTASATISFAQNTTPEAVRDGIKRVERAAMDLRADLRAETGTEQILNVFTAFTSDTAGRIVVEMAPSENRKMSGQKMVRQWEERVGDIRDVVELEFKATLNQPGSIVDIELASSSLSDLKLAADGLKERMAAINGLYQITDSFQRGKQELLIELKPLARNLGLNLDDVAMQVRQAYHGADVQNIQRGEQDIKVVVRYPAEERSSLWYLENMSIRMRDGSTVPLLTVADIEYGEGAAQINRHNRRRVIRVRAKLDDSVTSTEKVMFALKDEYLNAIPENFPGMSWDISGVQREKDEFKAFLAKAYWIAILGMYVMMATLFRSYAQPLMVMFAIPFGIIGALLGHLLLGMQITLWSLVGMIAVSGIVVNDNLVLVDFMNRNREKGVALMDSIRQAGGARFRPIMLTSLTTFGGLVPLMLETSLQAQFLIPMAVSIAFGVLFATLVSLVLVPATYYILHDAQQLFRETILFFSGAKTKTISVAEEVDQSFDSESEDDSGKLQWHVGLDEAYELGHKEGLKGDEPRVSPFELEVLSASWEAGWDDGHEEFLANNKAST